MGKYKVLRTTPPAKTAGRLRWRLPVFVIALSLIVIGAGLWWGLSRPKTSYVPEVTGRPHAAIDRTTFDYGDVKLGSTVQTVFRVKNTGDHALAFLGEPRVEVREGCWPPRAVVGATPLKPGEETTVTLQFMMHEGMDGPHDFRVHVLTNDPQQPEQEVVIRSNWVP